MLTRSRAAALGFCALLLGLSSLAGAASRPAFSAVGTNPAAQPAGTHRMSGAPAPVASNASHATAVNEVAIPYSAGWDYGKRSSARREFLRKSGFPTGRPGYVVDYIVPLSQGGADTPANMHFVPVEQARVTR